MLKVYQGEPTIDEGEAGDGQLVAAFPVTMGSKQYPLPIGKWKATTYAFLPPFNYQPELLEQPEDRQGSDACRRGRTGRSASPGST